MFFIRLQFAERFNIVSSRIEFVKICHLYNWIVKYIFITVYKKEKEKEKKKETNDKRRKTLLYILFSYFLYQKLKIIIRVILNETLSLKEWPRWIYAILNVFFFNCKQYMAWCCQVAHCFADPVLVYWKIMIIIKRTRCIGSISSFHWW